MFDVLFHLFTIFTCLLAKILGVNSKKLRHH